MAKKTITTGRASVTMDKDMTAFFLGPLKKIIPNFEATVKKELDKIEKEAEANWPKRQPRKKYNRRTGTFSFIDESQNSWKKFKRGIRIDPNGDIVVYLKNTASYSWAIKYGKDPKTKTGERIIEPQGKRAAQELLIKPMRKSSKVIVNALAKDLFKR
tara:strand:- start:2974 stop:3447 length:474 start_codon:yes stop_codon:yes gene_type:complete